MPNEKVETLVIGGGQAGLAMSAHLRNHGLPHLVIERHRIAERWRSERWDSLVANGPALSSATNPAAVPRNASRRSNVARTDGSSRNRIARECSRGVRTAARNPAPDSRNNRPRVSFSSVSTVASCRER